ncbi:unnamed protein product [Clavelina lepadiformis]|uniref:Uncharacterized protein n=1 Tax=Clavelina lepadiformis TaxID=159417 RepID=A0ABP0GMR6_CLALP
MKSTLLNSIKIYTIAVLVSAHSLAGVKGCHVEGHTEQKRSIRISMSSTDELLHDQAARNIQSFFPTCLQYATDEKDDYENIVHFVVEHTTWYEQSFIICSNEHDTKECWCNRMDLLLESDTVELEAAKQCISRYVEWTQTFGFVFEPLQLNIDLSSKAVVSVPRNNEREDAEVCPPRTIKNFDLCVSNKLAEVGVLNNPVHNFEAVLKFLKRKSKCSDCSCEKVFQQNKLVEEYFSAEKISCDSCWSTRVAETIGDVSLLQNATNACSATLLDNVYV